MSVIGGSGPPGGRPAKRASGSICTSLQVVYLFGRWWAVWRQLEEPEDTPPAQRWLILAVEPDPDAPHGVSFTGL